MGNGYFQFKQFTIRQDQCAMKVCTDASILGATFAKKSTSWPRILDIGSGTGLLMIMLAQQNKGEISGIEIDPAAFEQAQDNAKKSPWPEMIKVYPGDVRTYSFPHKFDLIITNPPFYEGDLVSPSESINLARHSKELTFSELLSVIDYNLTGDGSFGILLPYHRAAYFTDLAVSKAFYLCDRLSVRQTPKHDFFRSILHFSRTKAISVTSIELTIKNAEGGFSTDFIELMSDFYLPAAYASR